MAEGRSRSEWGHTSSVLCLMANLNRDPKATPRPFTPADFDPHEKARAAAPAKVTMGEVKDILMGLRPAKN
jgi:hypothetical protein